MIKFRAWHKEYKRMLKVIHLEWLDNEFEDLFKITGYDGGSIFGKAYNPHEVDLMQWTGLKDKNGKDLFEGDIIVFYPPWGSHAHLVERSKTNHNLIFTELYVRTIYPDEYQELDEINTECGIIEANKWECPELLIGYEND